MIIGLCGRAGSGKSSVAKYLRDKYGVEIVAFADPLKAMAMDIWGFTREQVYGDAKIKETIDPRLGFSPRQALQRLGTEICRKHLGSDVWINALFARRGCSRHYVVEDVRFRNEAFQLHDRGALVLRLNLPPGESYSADDGVHASEREVDLIDQSLVADIRPAKRGLEELFSLVDAALMDYADQHEEWR